MDTVVVEEAEGTAEVMDRLIELSVMWEKENSCWGYRANTPSDIEGRRIFLARRGREIVGYLFGKTERLEAQRADMPKDSVIFEAEELYVLPSCRSQGIGNALFRTAEERLEGEADYMVLSTATKNWKAVLHFYLEILEMRFWSATLFRKIGDRNPAD